MKTSWSSPSNTSFHIHLLGLDIQSGETHDLAPPGAPLIYVYASPDGQSLMYSGANAAADPNLLLVRAVDQGVVPSQPVGGLEGRPGNRYLSAWLDGARFAIIRRCSNIIGDGVDVVDTWKNTLHWLPVCGVTDRFRVRLARVH